MYLGSSVGTYVKVNDDQSLKDRLSTWMWKGGRRCFRSLPKDTQT